MWIVADVASVTRKASRKGGQAYLSVQLGGEWAHYPPLQCFEEKLFAGLLGVAGQRVGFGVKVVASRDGKEWRHITAFEAHGMPRKGGKS